MKGRRKGSAWLQWTLIISLLFGWLAIPSDAGFASPERQINTPEERARRLWEQLTPEERVGQLFLVTFPDTEVGENSPIYNLITQYHLGGVILARSNDNFQQGDNPAQAVWTMNHDLQMDAWSASQTEQTDPVTGTPFTPSFIPLTIAISQSGDGFPADQMLSGITQLPSLMAIGATWQPDLAQQMGSILGDELSALGFNFLIGPSLDVAESPRPESPGDLGVQSFGGDPFWVGEMGKAFIRGVHLGSQSRVAVAATHFPGLGSSDRLPQEEVATVRKSLEQLKQIELAPFFAVTGNAPDAETTTDALLTSHIRYQGFQGNIRATTRPISFDSQAFGQLMSLPQFEVWRNAGGVVLSDDLGSQAVRRFYAPSGTTFNARLIARDAFLAGNDLLYLSMGMMEDNVDDPFVTYQRILAFFAQKYREDSLFAQRVDQAGLRILTLKFKLYGTFTLANVIPAKEGLLNVGKSDELVFEVGRQAATLISPSPLDLEAAMPSPPTLQDRIVFITDTYSITQCSQCPAYDALAVDALEKAVIQLYGPLTGAEVVPQRLSSFSYQDLQAMLSGSVKGGLLETALQRANWVVFLSLDLDANRPTSSALREFLSTRSDLPREKHIVVFGMNAPYYLDSTDISNLTAYFGLYSKAAPFLDVAARLLFKEILPAPGALPVSVPSIGYDLISATAPDPDQVIPLTLISPQLPALEVGTPTPEIPPVPQVEVGGIVTVRTGVILDHNNHPVPDSTVVHFVLSDGLGGNLLDDVEAVTSGGVAEATLTLKWSGQLAIQVTSDPARYSDIIRVEVPALESDLETTTPAVTMFPPATQTLVPEKMTSTPVGALEPPAPLPSSLGLGDWLIALLTAWLVGWLAYRWEIRTGAIRWGVRYGLSAALGTLIGYSVFSRSGSFVGNWLTKWGASAVVLVALLGAFFGWGIASLVKKLQPKENSTKH